MTERHRPILILLAALLSCTPAAAETPLFPAIIGEPYTGRMVIDTFPIDGGKRMQRARGDAEVLFSPVDDDRIRFTTRATLDDGGNVDLTLMLAPDPGGGWRGVSDSGPTELTPTGRLLSVTELEGFHMVLTGEIGAEKGKLTLRRIPTKDAGTAPDAKMMTVFLFDVSQPSPDPPPRPPTEEASTTRGDRDCKRIEWRLVNRWTWGNGLSLSREPHCVR